MANTTWSPTDKDTNINLSGGSLIATASNNAAGGIRATVGQVSGKFYWECTTNATNGINTKVGILTGVAGLTSASTGSAWITQGDLRVDGVFPINGGLTLSNGSVACFALDCTAKLLWVRVGAAGLWNTSAGANPATGAGGVAVPNFGGANAAYPATMFQTTNDQTTANFGGSAFTGAVPSGFTAGFGTQAPAFRNPLAFVVS